MLRMTNVDFFTAPYALGYFMAPLTGLLTRGRILSSDLANYFGHDTRRWCKKQNGRQYQLPAVKEGLRDVLYRCPPP